MLGGREEFDPRKWPNPEFAFTDHRGQVWAIHHDENLQEVVPFRPRASVVEGSIAQTRLWARMARGARARGDDRTRFAARIGPRMGALTRVSIGNRATPGVSRKWRGPRRRTHS